MPGLGHGAGGARLREVRRTSGAVWVCVNGDAFAMVSVVRGAVSLNQCSRMRRGCLLALAE